MLIVRLSRPLPGGFPREMDDRLSHRHLDLLIDGLRPATRPPAPLGGPAMTFDDLRRLPLPSTSDAGPPDSAPS
jgi:hypothetical protein